MHTFNKDFEEWFNENILPTIQNASMVLVSKALMEAGWIAGYYHGVDVGCEISHR